MEIQIGEIEVKKFDKIDSFFCANSQIEKNRWLGKKEAIKRPQMSPKKYNQLSFQPTSIYENH